MKKLFTIGYIEHDKHVFNMCLGASIKNLNGTFDTISTSDEHCPAINYNHIKKKTDTPFLILTHQDVSFSADLLKRLEESIELLGDRFGAIGFAGPNGKWSNPYTQFVVETLDSAFIVVKTDDGLSFDEKVFNEYHCYVEDYCAQLSRRELKTVATILISSADHGRMQDLRESYLVHHSVSINELGFAWGNYWHYRQLLERKWPGIKTT